LSEPLLVVETSNFGERSINYLRFASEEEETKYKMHCTPVTVSENNLRMTHRYRL